MSVFFFCCSFFFFFKQKTAYEMRISDWSSDVCSSDLFDALAIVTQDRHAPPESGALAKAASGALERVPWVRVVNLSRALEEIAEAGFWRIGLTGQDRKSVV